MEKEPTIVDVIMILEDYPDNLTARRWLKDQEALKRILEYHNSWNEDHRKFNEPDMVATLDVNVIYLMEAAPSLIDNKS